MVSACPFCLQALEESNHLLIHCSFSSVVWNSVLDKFGMAWVMPTSVAKLSFSWDISSVSPKCSSLCQLQGTISPSVHHGLSPSRNSRISLCLASYVLGKNVQISLELLLVSRLLSGIFRGLFRYMSFVCSLFDFFIFYICTSGVLYIY